MPYDCIKDTSKTAHSIAHKHKYTYNTEYFILDLESLEGTHTSETVNPTSYTHQHIHSLIGQAFSTNMSARIYGTNGEVR